MSAAHERASRIVETAIELAERGGFENVRLREVAAHSGVALGTLYRHFRSKGDLLVAALARELEALEERVAAQPPVEASVLERVEGHFRLMTRTLCRRPKLARALLRALASGDPELTPKVHQFHYRTTRLCIAALRGEAGASAPTPRERDVAELLQHVWFSAMVGWAGGLRGPGEVVEVVRGAAALVLGAPEEQAP